MSTPQTDPAHYPTRGSATVEVNASAADVYAFLTDLERLPTLSPENERCEFLDGASAIEVGVRFRGHNNAGGYEWHADCEVTVAEPASRFVYVVPPEFEHLTTWSYEIEPTGDQSCRVTESFDAPMLAMPDIYPGTIEGRHANLTKACQTTMDNLRAAFAN
jgi:uncharacterized protein YndB with AHSA1/START domain